MQITLSYSSISLFHQCPYAFYLHKIKNITGENEATQYGKMIHSEMDKFFKEGTITDTIKPFINPYIVKLRQYENFETEKEFSITLLPNLSFVSVIDFLLIKDIPLIIDWKTNKYKNANPLQLYIYAYVLQKNGIGKEQYEGEIYYLRYGHGDRYSINKEELTKAYDYISHSSEKIYKKLEKYRTNYDERIFEKTKNNCSCCLYNKYCIENNNIYEQELLNIFK